MPVCLRPYRPGQRRSARPRWASAAQRWGLPCGPGCTV